MLCSFLLHSKANQLHTHTHTHIYIYIHSFLFVCLFVLLSIWVITERWVDFLCYAVVSHYQTWIITWQMPWVFFLYLCGVCICVCVCVCVCVWPYICEDYVQYQIQIWISNALADILAAMIIGGKMAKKYLKGLYFKPGEKIIFTQLFHWILENLLSFTNLKDRQVKSIQFKNTSFINSYLLKCIALFNFSMTAF